MRLRWLVRRAGVAMRPVHLGSLLLASQGILDPMRCTRRGGWRVLGIDRRGPNGALHPENALHPGNRPEFPDCSMTWRFPFHLGVQRVQEGGPFFRKPPFLRARAYVRVWGGFAKTPFALHPLHPEAGQIGPVDSDYSRSIPFNPMPATYLTPRTVRRNKSLCLLRFSANS
jgi:hypothetical protein